MGRKLEGLISKHLCSTYTIHTQYNYLFRRFGASLPVQYGSKAYAFNHYSGIYRLSGTQHGITVYTYTSYTNTENYLFRIIKCT